ncbi:MAG: serine O-acetyltransferase [Hyphomicrobiales bacterium]|nr:serine O-acetyltransferase [Hyphomicrobiales bacterium]
MAKLKQRPVYVTPVSVDSVWKAVRDEAHAVIEREPVLSTFIYTTILNHSNLEGAVIQRISDRLSSTEVSGGLIRQSFQSMLDDWPKWSEYLRSDLAAVYDRDPACHRFIDPILYFKGFHAIQCHRLAEWCNMNGRSDFALYLQSRSSEVFQTDINPSMKMGKGIFIDHATGVVIGETVIIGDNVSILHNVTLGGTGKDEGDRHPKIGCGVLIGAGAKILGNVKIGNCSRIAAGSLVLKDIPSNVTVAGIPGKVVGVAGCPEPSRSMDQILAEDKN